MADQVENPVLEQLRHIRFGVDALRETVADHGVRLSSMEEHTGQVLVQLAGLNRRGWIDSTSGLRGSSVGSNWLRRKARH